MIYAGWPEERLAATSLDAAMQSAVTHIGDDAMALISHRSSENIAEFTGNRIVAAAHALAAFAAGTYVISGAVEADPICGAALVARGESARGEGNLFISVWRPDGYDR